MVTSVECVKGVAVAENPSPNSREIFNFGFFHERYSDFRWTICPIACFQ